MHVQNASGSAIRGQRSRGLLAVGLLGFLAMAVQAEVVHKWVDEKGQVHFGDRPPVHLKTEVLMLHVVDPGHTPPTPVTAPEDRVSAPERTRRASPPGRENERRSGESSSQQAREEEARRAAQEEARQERLRELTGTYGTRAPATRKPLDSRF